MPENPRLALAWKAMAWALLIHVIDEAWNNFLVFYNPTVIALEEKYPWLPMPVFQFEYWLGGLLAAVAILFAITPVARRGSRPIVIAARILAVVMTFNAIGHIAVTAAGRTPSGMAVTGQFPGFWSSPFLIAASAWLWRESRQRR